MNGYADSGLPRMRTAFARIVPVSSDADARPEDRGRATLQEKYDKKVLGSFSSTVYGARQREKERERTKKGESHGRLLTSVVRFCLPLSWLF